MILNKIIKIKQYLFIYLFLLLWAGFSFVGTPDALSQEDQISYNIPYIPSEPVIDGEISEGEWEGAERVNLIYETSPSQNIPAIVDTEVIHHSSIPLTAN